MIKIEKELLCFIKFGEKEYMEKLADGEFYFSTAKRFAEIEDELVRGQGDKFEGKAQVNVTHMKATDNDTGKAFEVKVSNFVTFGAEKVKFKPVYCITALTSDDAKQFTDKENYRIDFPYELQRTIKSHFPKADTAVIFTNPISLLNRIEAKSKTRLEHGFVNYFNMHPVGLEWIEFVNKKEKIDKATKYTLNTQDAYKLLLCKDLFFKNEKEYRFVFADDEIPTPEVKKIYGINEVQVIELNELFSNGISKGKIE